MTAITDRGELEAQRIQSGLSLAKVARKAAVSYQRLWRFFSFMGDLEEDELERVRAALEEATPLQERSEEEDVTTVGGRPAASDGNEEAARVADGTSR